MNNKGISAALRRFIETHITDVGQLEIVLHLQRDRDRFCDAATVADALHLSRGRVAADLESLARAGLLDVRLASSLIYRFSPATPAIAAVIEEIAEAYTSQRAELVALGHLA